MHSKTCTFGKLRLEEELRRGQGLTSTIMLKCSMCEKNFLLHTENPNRAKSVINVGAVWGTLATGSCYEHLSELLSCMDIPAINKNLFYDLEEKLGRVSST